ncbi:MAG: hypothetical protein QOG68_2752 [Solirubrobacteraceae bacterium]|jgi:hypothetical protein|nr:hypothetical protein [Solirubrobacteraceae bacterium]
MSVDYKRSDNRKLVILTHMVTVDLNHVRGL